MKAWCYRSGEIVFGHSLPKGCILIAQGPAKPLREMICAVARHAYDGKTLLVPGIPEADTEKEAADALERFLDWIAPRVTKMQEAR